MRIYGSIQICFWEKPETQQLTDQAKLLAIYLLTGPHSNMLGCFRLPGGYITEDLRWNTQEVKEAFQELSDINFLTRDERGAWLVIHNFLKWNPIQNPKQGIGVQKLFDLVPIDSSVMKPLINGLLTYGKYLSKEFEEHLHALQQGFETVFLNCIADKDQKQDQNQENRYMSNSAAEEKKVKANLLRSQAMEVLQFLNEKTGRMYRPVDTNLKLIIARLTSGATPSECFQVIAKKTREWKDNPMMSEYLRPATLFNATKFEQYVGELVVAEAERGQS